MIIDAILDRRNGAAYDPKEFYDYVSGWNGMNSEYEDIARALDCGEENDVKRLLCEYIRNNEYSLALCSYIRSVDWLTPSPAFDFGESAKMLCDAIRKFADNPDAIDNFEYYLTRHFRSWLECWADTPEGMASEFKQFASIEV